MIKNLILRWLGLSHEPVFNLRKPAVNRNVIATLESPSSDREFMDDRTYKFHITPARGGLIMTVSRYDERTDRMAMNIHVIHDDENVSEVISQIVSMELLQRSN